MVETVILTAFMATLLTVWRHALRAGRRAWVALVWWEKCLLIMCMAPIPGPVDEIVGGWLIARGLKRLSS